MFSIALPGKDKLKAENPMSSAPYHKSGALLPKAELLACEMFITLAEVRVLIEQWQCTKFCLDHSM